MKVMRKILILSALIVVSSSHLAAVFPDFYGARSLSLGHSVFASGWDASAIFLNPAALAEAQVSLSAYQFQQSYRDYLGFEDKLQGVLARDLSSIDSLNADQKQEAVDELAQLWSSAHGISGFSARLPALIGRNFGFSVAWVRAGRMHPQRANAFDIPAASWGSAEIDALKMEFIGLDYRQFSLAYALDLTREMRLGVGLHYLTGKGSQHYAGLTGVPFTENADIRDLSRYAWEQAGKKFSRILTDLSLVVSMGQTFQGMVLVKNLGNPRIELDADILNLPQQLIAGIAFRPSPRLAVYLNIDLKPVNMWFDDKKVQPLSLGVETAFYQQRIFLRAGIWNDLQEKYFLGKRSNVQYGIGIGFRMSRFILDLGLALDASGSIAGLAVGAAIWVQ